MAVAVGTSHGAYKRRSDSEKLRFDILKKIATAAPRLPIVLHGASTIPQELVETINKFGGKLIGTGGIPPEQIRRAASLNVCKVNIDSDARLAWMASLRESLASAPENFDPRKPLTAARAKMTELYVYEIEKIMKSNDRMTK